MPATLAEIVAELPAPADLGYEGEADLLTVATKKPAGGQLSADQQAYNALHAALLVLQPRLEILVPAVGGSELQDPVVAVEVE